MNPRCPVHRSAMVVEDQDSAYGQRVWLCRYYRNGCREVAYTGPSDNEIYAKEYGG